MSVDISGLGNLNTAEPLDMSIYPDASEPAPLPTAGRYTVQAPDSFPDEAFRPTIAGFLSAQIDPTIVGPTSEGYTIKFTRVSAKPFKRRGVTVSQMGDYLRACGRTTNVGGDPQELADAVAETANTTYEVDVDWRVYDKETKWSLQGMQNFPSDGNGGHLPVIESPNRTDENGNPVKLRANLVVTRFVSAQ